MGPNDSYLLQYTKDVKCFWADSDNLALGAQFKERAAAAKSTDWKRILPQVGAH